MITSWRDRLVWTGQRSPDARERMAAMLAEIRELRKLQARTAARLESAKARASHWKKVAYATQRDLDRARLETAGAMAYSAPGQATTKTGTRPGTNRGL